MMNGMYNSNPGRFMSGNGSFIDIFKLMQQGQQRGQMGGYGAMGAALGGLPLALKGASAFMPMQGASQEERPMAMGQGLGGAASGAITGASIGSVVPGIGTAAGAVVGGILGSAPAWRRLFGKSSRQRRI